MNDALFFISKLPTRQDSFSLSRRLSPPPPQKFQTLNCGEVLKGGGGGKGGKVPPPLSKKKRYVTSCVILIPI